MRKDTTKKFLKRENRYVNRMTSREIVDFLSRKKKKIACDMIDFINVFGTKSTHLNMKNILGSGDKTRERVSRNRKIVEFKIVEFNMVYCEEGSFTMGHIDFKNDNPPRLETIESSFLLGETEVTQELYELVMDYNPSFFENTSHYPNAPKHPVEQLSWYDAIEFCNQLSELQGLDKCYRITNISTKDTDGNEMNRIMYANVDWNTNANGYRLPIEKEWEYAAKAGTNNRYAGTDDENKLGEYAWYYNNSIALGVPTHPVATKKPNEWGFYDMTGNVYEWCWDKYDPIGYRAFRGGSFEDSHSNEKKLYITSCQKEEPNDRDKIVIGFRICRTF